MANALFTAAKEEMITGSLDWTTDNRAILGDAADDTIDVANDNMLDDVAPAYRVAVSGTIASPTTVGGVADAADTTVSSVTGDVFEHVLVYGHTGTESTSPLRVYIDTGSGLPGTPNGSDFLLTWNAGGIFAA